MAVLAKKPHPEEDVLSYISRLLVNTRLSFATVGIFGGVLVTETISADPYSIVTGACLGFFASVIASEEIQR